VTHVYIPRTTCALLAARAFVVCHSSAPHATYVVDRGTLTNAAATPVAMVTALRDATDRSWRAGCAANQRRGERAVASRATAHAVAAASVTLPFIMLTLLSALT